ncbi:MAG TPA: hypothetical protein VLG28_14915 [Acidimicrobiia bacterium]|jgi:hypothetical protein|nr:hypothetical protein [Acidimicrobiia bacterium]
MQPAQIIQHIDDWLDEHGWRLGDSEINFALDVRQLVASLENEQEAVLVTA